MISIEAYRASIWSFVHIARSKCQKNYDEKNIIDNITEDSSHFVKSFFVFIFLTIIYLNLNMSFLKLCCY